MLQCFDAPEATDPVTVVVGTLRECHHHGHRGTDASCLASRNSEQLCALAQNLISPMPQQWN